MAHPFTTYMLQNKYIITELTCSWMMQPCLSYWTSVTAEDEFPIVQKMYYYLKVLWPSNISSARQYTNRYDLCWCTSASCKKWMLIFNVLNMIRYLNISKQIKKENVFSLQLEKEKDSSSCHITEWAVRDKTVRKKNPRNNKKSFRA